MLLNNIEIDTKVKMVEAQINQVKLAKAMGTTGQFLNRVCKANVNIVNRTYVKMMEHLDYDIKIEYVKREEV